MNYSEKKQKQIAVFALINGIRKASECYMIPEEEVAPHLEKLGSSDMPFFEVIRNEVLRCFYAKGAKATSETWGLSEGLIEKLVAENSPPEALKTYTETGANISPKDFRTYISVGVSPGGSNDEPALKKKRKISEGKKKTGAEHVSK
jgi:hypothetical protein